MQAKKYLKDAVGVVGAFLTFWVTGVLLLPVVNMVWPLSSGTDLPLRPQHFPSMIVGFLFALYAFRRITASPKQA
jgi:hypothetical protein